jgi:BirA family biotin operon repressor/biotin-[acetyl-CoA-carboxylase] ligase
MNPETSPVSFRPLPGLQILQGVSWIPEAESTNTLALAAREDGLVIVADAQTAGRGQHGRRWASAAGLGLWFSVCLRGAPQGLNFAAPLAVRDALAPFAPMNMKWPNDVLHEGRKLCGVLVEHRAGWTALGIGINVNHAREDFPEVLQTTATSLRLATGIEQDREALLDLVLRALDARLAQWRAGDTPALFRAWAEACAIMGQPVDRAGITGVAEGLREDGALLVRTGAGLITLTGWPGFDEGN